MLSRREFVATAAAASAAALIPGCSYLRTGEESRVEGPVVSADWLRDPPEDVVPVDVRNEDCYDGTSIPGAIRLPWDRFREEKTDGDETWPAGFVGAERAAEMLGEVGLGIDDVPVFYDDLDRDAGATASYLYWVYKYLGGDAKVLLPGVEAWTGETTSEEASRSERNFDYSVDERRIVSTEFLEENYRDLKILDVRSEAEYLGKAGEGYVGGHIPEALNVPYEENRAPDGSLKPREELERLYSKVSKDERVVVYCNTGRRASYTYLVLELLGFDAALYDDSWARWGLKEADRPSVYPGYRGEEPGGGGNASEVLGEGGVLRC